MEALDSHDASAKPPPLTSDQLNYLIWRYLQESGYGDAAVKLQRDWKVDPQTLPFAKRLKGQALIQLVQKGLRLYHLNQTIDENGQASRLLSPEKFFFGPDTEPLPGTNREVVIRPTLAQRAPSPELVVNNGTRKHARESGPNGPSEITPSQPATKRSRKTANATSTERTAHQQQQASLTTTDSGNNSAMDIDQINGQVVPAANGKAQMPRDAGSEETSAGTNGVPVPLGVQMDTRMDLEADVDHAATGVSPGAGVGIGVGALEAHAAGQEQFSDPLLPVQLVSTLANGENVGVQVCPAKVANLGPTTTILGMPDNSHVLHSSWSPSDPSLFITSAEQSCGVWRASSGSAWSEARQPRYNSLIESGDEALVTATAWQPSGSYLAIATYAEQAGQIHIFDTRDLSLTATLPASQHAISSLRWMPSGAKLVGVAAYDAQVPSAAPSSSLLLWDLSGNFEFASPSFVPVAESMIDLDCIHQAGHGVLGAAGDGAVYQVRTEPDFGIDARWTSQATDRTIWNYVRCVEGSMGKAIVMTASMDSTSLWMPGHDILKRDVHNAPITGLQVRSLQASTPNLYDFATSSMDCTVHVWRFAESTHTLNHVFKVTLGHMSPVMALSFSPDGFCLAGAGYDKVRVWNSESTHQVLAAWDSKDTEWRGATLREDDQMSIGGQSSVYGDQYSPDHCLSWDASSKKIVFSLGGQIALVDFQR